MPIRFSAITMPFSPIKLKFCMVTQGTVIYRLHILNCAKVDFRKMGQFLAKNGRGRHRAPNLTKKLAHRAYLLVQPLSLNRVFSKFQGYDVCRQIRETDNEVGFWLISVFDDVVSKPLAFVFLAASQLFK